MIETKNQLSYGRILVTLNERLIRVYELNEDGISPTRPDLPDGSRVVVLSKKDEVLMDGRVRGNYFRPAGRLRRTLGKEFPLKDLV